jgi:hypothetical protein
MSEDKMFILCIMFGGSPDLVDGLIAYLSGDAS